MYSPVLADARRVGGPRRSGHRCRRGDVPGAAARLRAGRGPDRALLVAHDRRLRVDRRLRAAARPVAPRLGYRRTRLRGHDDPPRAARQGRALALQVGAARPRGRSPSGRGRGFACTRPSTRSAPSRAAGRGAVVAAASMWAGMAVLAIPGRDHDGAAAHVASTRVPDPSVYDTSAPDRQHASGRRHAAGGRRRRRRPAGDFFRYAFAASLTTGALVTFGIIGYHLTVEGIVPVAAVPSRVRRRDGRRGDRGARSSVPSTTAPEPQILSSCRCSWRWCPPWRSAPSLAAVVVGVRGVGLRARCPGLHDQGGRRRPRRRRRVRATAYGVFAGIQGAAGDRSAGPGAGWLYATLADGAGRGRRDQPAGRAGAAGARSSARPARRRRAGSGSPCRARPGRSRTAGRSACET